jgi:Tfp pilus assembly protein FimT
MTIAHLSQEGKMFQSRRVSEKGFSLLETLIVVGLIATLTIVAIPIFVDLVRSYRVSSTASEIAVSLRFARNASIKRKKDYTVNIYNESAVTPNTPNTYVVNGPDNPVTHTVADFVKITTASTLSACVFSPNGSATAGDVIIEDKSTGTPQYKISVLTTGAVGITKMP